MTLFCVINDILKQFLPSTAIDKPNADLQKKSSGTCLSTSIFCERAQKSRWRVTTKAELVTAVRAFGDVYSSKTNIKMSGGLIHWLCTNCVPSFGDQFEELKYRISLSQRFSSARNPPWRKQPNPNLFSDVVLRLFLLSPPRFLLSLSKRGKKAVKKKTPSMSLASDWTLICSMLISYTHSEGRK